MNRKERNPHRPWRRIVAISTATVALTAAFIVRRSDLARPAPKAVAMAPEETAEGARPRRCGAETRAAQGESLVISLARSGMEAARRPIRVALFWEDTSCDPTEELDEIRADAGLPWTWEEVNPADVTAGALRRFDVVVFPGGRGSRQLATLGEGGKRAVIDYVKGGGGYVGICAGAFLATARYLGLVQVDVLAGDRTIPGVGRVSLMARGPGLVRTELTPAGSQALGLPSGKFAVEFAGGPIFLNAEGNDHPFVVLASYRTEVWNYDWQRGTMLGSPSILAAWCGLGKVVVFSPHPERTVGLRPLVRRAILAATREPKVGARDDHPPPDVPPWLSGARSQ